MLKLEATFAKECGLKHPSRRGASGSLDVGLQMLRLETHIQDDYDAGSRENLPHHVPQLFEVAAGDLQHVLRGNPRCEGEA